MSNRANPNLPILCLPVLFLFMAVILLTNSQRYSDPIYVFQYPDSYRTGIPSPNEIHYGTRKVFTEDRDGGWAEEAWEWSQADRDSNQYDHSSACGHVRWWYYSDLRQNPALPYEASAYENESDTHSFKTLKEADDFVWKWCKP